MRRVELLRREITRRRSTGHRIGIVVAGVALASLVRLVSDQGRFGVPFVTYAPVVLLVAILFRWRMATLAALLSLASIMIFFHLAPPGSSSFRPLVMICAVVITSAALIYIGDTLHDAIVAIELQRQKFETFNTELQHRSMNTLQVIQALVSQAAGSSDPEASYKALSGRISAMAAANKLLGPSQLQACDLRELIAKAIRPFPYQRFNLFGPQCQITGKSGVRLMIVLHELGTNAIKYGALSNEEGTISLGWQLRGDDIELHWKENGGPLVMPPTQQGLGSGILSPSEGLSKVEMEFDPAGLKCWLVAKAELDISPKSAPVKAPSGRGKANAVKTI